MKNSNKSLFNKYVIYNSLYTIWKKPYFTFIKKQNC